MAGAWGNDVKSYFRMHAHAQLNKCVGFFIVYKLGKSAPVLRCSDLVKNHSLQ